ncbi:M48 family metalloprotease [Aliiroseovarius sp. KMU-50]|uniref:M48 family metalloprotease n=1 Tax=Aliiroseovarius salicola TaxID=3009082 RepID=A0ABT4W3Z2_9RHOB|nr:M48 family metalloprotease [Aliiroseovarius sp. KMU-50]MDA5095195.1 M48 family metalloprotease [Aliiroseovarius sp. KMU-50]
MTEFFQIVIASPLRKVIAVSMLALAGCTTTTDLPEAQSSHQSQAEGLYQAAQYQNAGKLSREAAVARFHRVMPRVRQAGVNYCRTTRPGGSDAFCAVDIAIDPKLKEPNAYFTFNKGRPIVRVSVPLLQESGSDDEVAFVIGHEYGHMLGQHIQKTVRQAQAGALILGALTAAMGADASTVDLGMDIGATIGGRAYSKEYELESDILGTRIAYAAGYDPVKGVQFFVRSAAKSGSRGQGNFWSTHPSDRRRVEVVLAEVERIRAGR